MTIGEAHLASSPKSSSASGAGARRAWPAALVIVGLAAFINAVVLMLPSNPAADVVHYKYWTKQIATFGVAGAYSGTYPETAAIYPPVTMYGYRVAGWIYRRGFDPAFDMEAALSSHALTVLVKLVAVVPHLIASLAIFGLLNRRFGAKPALLATAAFALNPAAIFDAAFWGQPDIVHAALLLAAIYLWEEDRPLAGFVFIGLAAATKPQAWALLPFLAYVSFRRFGVVKTVLGGVTAGVAAIGACLPFLVYGTFGELLTLPALIAETMPVVSANAHNVWWLVTDARPDFVLDAEPLFGPITYRLAAMALSLGLMAYAVWRTDVRGRDGALSMMAAYLAFGWFMFTTRAHENHAFFALPLLVMATPRSVFAWGMFGMLTLTLFLNMTIHDYGFEEVRMAYLNSETWRRIQLANASLNVTLLLIWTARIWVQPLSGIRRPAPA